MQSPIDSLARAVFELESDRAVTKQIPKNLSAESMLSTLSVSPGGVRNKAIDAWNKERDTGLSALVGDIMRQAQMSGVDIRRRPIGIAHEQLATSDTQASRNERLASQVLSKTISMVAGESQTAYYDKLVIARPSVEAYNKDHPRSSTDMVTVVSDQSGGTYGEARKRYREIVTESFSGRTRDLTTAVTISLNLGMVVQHEAAETLFPTIVLEPGQSAYAISVSLVYVLNATAHSVSGAPTLLSRQLLQDAARDPSILENDLVLNVPIYRANDAGNVAKFADPAYVGTMDTVKDGIPITTGYLRPGVMIGIPGICATNATLVAGTPDAFTDEMDPTVRLDSWVVAFGPSVASAAFDPTKMDVVTFDVKDMPGALFNHLPHQQGLQDEMVLNFNPKMLLVTGNEKNPNGTPVTYLAPLKAANYQVALEIMVDGRVNLQTGNMFVNMGMLRVSNVFDANGVVVPNPPASILSLFADNNYKQIGYKQTSMMANLNMRQRGKVIDNTTITQIYGVPQLSPFCRLLPNQSNVADRNAQGDVLDQSVVSTLLNAIQIQSTNNALRTLHDTFNVLSQYKNNLNDPYNLPETIGIARYAFKPYVAKLPNIDMMADLNVIQSQDLSQAITSKVVNVLFNEAAKMYRDTNWRQAYSLYNGTEVKPVIMLVVDQAMGRWLTREGDMRTFGNQFPDVRILEFPVVTGQYSMTNKIFMVFGDPNALSGSGAADSFNISHFGMRLMRPEMVTDAVVTRNGSVQREISMAPSYKHVVNFPAMVEVDIVNLDVAVATRIAVSTQAV